MTASGLLCFFRDLCVDSKKMGGVYPVLLVVLIGAAGAAGAAGSVVAVVIRCCR